MKRLSGMRGIYLLSIVVLLGAMAFDTTVISGDRSAEIDGPSFVASEFVEAEFVGVANTIEESAIKASELIPAILADSAAAGAKYGLEVSGKFVYPISATGVVTKVDERFATVAVDGLPPDASVRFPVGDVVNGSPIRDVTGTMTFGDFPGQTEFQSVSNQFKLKIISDIVSGLDLTRLEGAQVTVVGAWSSGGPASTFVIQPVNIEVS